MQRDEDYSRWRAERRFRLRVVMVTTPAVLGAASILYGLLGPDPMFSGDPDVPQMVSVAGLGLLAMSAMAVLMLYLQTGFRRSSSRDTAYREQDGLLRDMWHRLERLDDRHDGKAAMLEERLDEIDARLQSERGLSEAMSDEDRSSLVETIRTQLVGESADEVLSAMQARVETHAASNARTKMLDRQFGDSLRRLGQEVSALSRRGNLNLVLGILTTVTGLLILGYYVFQARPAGQDPWLFTTHFLPRLTLVVFIEVFAYFFLRLYKSSLAEIKFFQNETTNLEAKFIALSVALEADKQETCDGVIAELSRTERNHILEKGQTTVELEHARADKDILPDFMAKVLALLGKPGD